MNEILQIIGSVASILGVPLAVYLYLKSQVQKYTQVRREIVKRLSHQIGEGRTIGLFELNSVIHSLVRENRLRNGSISPNTVIEDLIAETVSSPLLESSRKEQLIKELSEVHSLGRTFQMIKSDDAIFRKFLEHISQNSKPEDESQKVENKIEEVKEASRDSSKTPELFGLISAILASLGAAASVAGFTQGLELLPKFLDSNILTGLSTGIIASIIAALAVSIISRQSRKK